MYPVYHAGRPDLMDLASGFSASARAFILDFLVSSVWIVHDYQILSRGSLMSLSLLFLNIL